MTSALLCVGERDMKNRVWRAGGQKEPRAGALMLSSYSVPIDSVLQPSGQERANE